VVAGKFPDQILPTQIHYVDGRPQSLRLRRCKLLVAEGDLEREVMFDAKSEITVGAMDDNDLVLRDDTVSRYHCKIVQEGESYVLVDLDSTNGSFINRVRIREAFLKPNCTIALGKTQIKFLPIDERVRVLPSARNRYGDVIGQDVKIREIFGVLEKISPTDTTVVIEGETGTGKDVVARSIHRSSLRADRPFMVFDCGAVPENLIESELFGHEKGSFTGAIMTRQGLFELANGGTIFLDELGELSLDLQPKLLRVLEQREVKRVGSNRPIRVDVRVIAATNRDLEDDVSSGRFREDLYYRLSVVRIKLPPLRERPDDIPLLGKHFLRGHPANRLPDGDPRITDISPDAMDVLASYGWPGNVRELLNVIERAVSFAEGTLLEVRDLPDHVSGVSGVVHTQRAAAESRAGSVDSTFKEAKERWVSTFERDYIMNLLRKNDGNISHAAREADIDRKYFRKLMRKYGITADDTTDDDVADED
jgi:transcriptional regulator with GAF, ATPase, and Fis domain